MPYHKPSPQSLLFSPASLPYANHTDATVLRSENFRVLGFEKENVHLDEQYFDVISSKTVNGIRKVPIVDKVLPFYKAWFEDNPECAYLIHTPDGKHFQYRNYYDSYFHPLMEQLKIDRIPHCCRHTCISMLAEAGVDQTIIKKIVGHSSAMTLTEKVYTHFDIKELVDAINKI